MEVFQGETDLSVLLKAETLPGLISPPSAACGDGLGPEFHARPTWQLPGEVKARFCPPHVHLCGLN